MLLECIESLYILYTQNNKKAEKDMSTKLLDALLNTINFFFFTIGVGKLHLVACTTIHKLAHNVQIGLVGDWIW
jgi:hypothetical protein